MNENCCAPGCCTTTYARRYWTREEKARWLEGYAAELDQELKAVKERIEELRKP